MRGVYYDPAIVKSESGRRLYERWKRVKRDGCDESFDDYPDFYDWAIATGYTLGDRLYRYDNSLPYSSENCYWSDAINAADEEMSADWRENWCKKWNETVNMIRRYFGLPEI